jgi:AAA15 family ATPase/GTPase
MLERLHLKNVGPAPELEMEFAPRVNLITGDNGLGKSFLLEVGWWALTGYLFGNFSPNKTSSLKPEIAARILMRNGSVEFNRAFNYRSRIWQYLYYRILPKKSRIKEGNSDIEFEKMVKEESKLIIYQKINDFFAITSINPEKQEEKRENRRSIIILESQQLWNGLEQNGKIISNGLIRDWVTWQLKNGEAFRQFKAALATLSSHEGEKLEPGELTILDDARDIPTLKMPYGQEVPITQASAGIKRVVSLAYMLVWTWQEHLRAAELTRQEPAREIVLLIDELEQHLHPRWQLVILPALLETVKELMKSDVRVQIIATTHSPLVMASLEPLYDNAQDAWFDLNLVEGKVTLEKMPWRRRGDASAWLTSEAFDLPLARSRESAAVLHKAAEATSNPKLTKKKFLEIDQELRGLLGETDPFWIRWQYFGEDKGWL